MTRGLFIAGTGTDVGKTHVAAMIARALIEEGRRVGVYKPVASGCRQVGDAVVADDARQLWEAANRPGSFDRVCPQRFLAPLAPPRAAREEGRRVDSDLLRTGLDYWRGTCDVLLVEGAGGLMSPLSNSVYNIDLAAEIGFPLVIVAANQLGVINETLQTLITSHVRAPHLLVAGIVLNHPTPRDRDASLATNAEEIAQRSSVPLLATVAHGQTSFSPNIDWFALSKGPATEPHDGAA